MTIEILIWQAKVTRLLQESEELQARSRNLLLASLPKEARERRTPFLCPTALEFRDTLIAPENPITQGHFINDAILAFAPSSARGSLSRMKAALMQMRSDSWQRL